MSSMFADDPSVAERFHPFRVIPCLLISGQQGAVKTTRFSRPTYVGDVLNALRIFNEKEVDEIVVLDIDAARSRREPDLELVSVLAGECFMPLAYGGGVASAATVRAVVRCGVEKVVMNTAALENPDVLRAAADAVGSQSVVAAIDVRTSLFGSRYVSTRAGSQRFRGTLDEAIQTVERAGAGEILLQSVDRDGTMSGFDLKLIAAAARSSTLPLVALGGARGVADLALAHLSGASAVAAGSMFVFHGRHRAVLITYPKPAELHAALANARQAKGTEQ